MQLPDGLFYRANGSVRVYYVKAGVVYEVHPEAIKSWRANVRTVDKMDIYTMPMGDRMIGFRDGTIIRLDEDNSSWLISGGLKRSIPDPALRQRFGGRMGAVKVSRDAFNLHKAGKPIGSN